MRPSGVWVATPTFFDDSGALSLGALEAHFERLAAAGVHGLVPCGTTGETPTLDSSEWRDVVALAVRVARRKGMGVMAGCGGNDTRGALERVKEAKGLGCDSALVVCPYYNKPTAAGLEAHFTKIATEGGLPIVLYNIPGRTGVNLTPDSTARLFSLDQVVGIKESTGNLSQWIEIAEKVDLARKALLAGDDNAVATVMALGGSGVVSVGANVDPSRFVQLVEHARDGRFAEAFALQIRLNPLIRSLFLETNPAPVKHALSRRFGTPGALRLPLVPVTAPTASAIDSCLGKMELTA